MAPAVACADQLARCQAELREIHERPDVQRGDVPAWLVALGEADWLTEAALIENERFIPRKEKPVGLHQSN
jgi:hypothetical protein